MDVVSALPSTRQSEAFGMDVPKSTAQMVAEKEEAIQRRQERQNRNTVSLQRRRDRAEHSTGSLDAYVPSTGRRGSMQKMVSYRGTQQETPYYDVSDKSS